MTFADNGNPFPGMRSFEREQAHLFFGRERQIRDLMAKLRVHRFLPIVGVSGSGKSSLVRAGLIPTLTGNYVGANTSDWRVVLFRPGGRPMQELAEKLCREFAVTEVDDTLQVLRGSTAGLARVARQHLKDGQKLLVLVDQFEELFRYGDEADAARETNEAGAFVKLLLAAAGQSEHPLPEFENVPVFVVTTMRSDFLGKCSRFRGLPEALNRSQYLIPRLTREEQRDAIAGPVEMANGSIEPALVQRLLNDLGDNPDQLPALQHALMRTWEQSAGAKAMTVAGYDAIGGMAESLNRDADRVYRRLSEDVKKIARRIFKRLVLPGAPDSETRAPTPQSELVAVTGEHQYYVEAVIHIFQKRGFLTVSNDDDPIIDIPHESLIRGWRRLTEWVDEESGSAAIYRRLVDTLELHSRIGVWLVDPELQLTLNWRDDATPNKAWAARYDSRFVEAMEFLDQSQLRQQIAVEQQERQRRFQLNAVRIVAVVLGTLLLLAVGAGAVAIYQRGEALKERAMGSRLIYDSGILFAGKALASGQFGEASKSLGNLWDPRFQDMRGFEWYYLWQITHEDQATLAGHTVPMSSIAYSPDGKILVSASDTRIRLWDVATHKEVAILSGHTSSVMSLRFSPDGQTLASSGLDGVKFWDVAARKEVASFAVRSAVRSIAFSPDGQTLATIEGVNKTVLLWKVATRQRMADGAVHSEPLNSLAFSPDGKILASSCHEQINLWDMASRRVLTTIARGAFSLAFSPDGKILGSDNGKSVELRDLTTNTARYLEVGSYVRSIAFSHDGKIVASGSDDQKVRSWDVGTGRLVSTFSGHSAEITSLVFSSDGKTLASASNDGTVKFWDVSARQEESLFSLDSEVMAVAFSGDGKILAATGKDGEIRLWDITTRKSIINFADDYLPAVARPIALSPDGKTIASLGRDKRLKLWDITRFGSQDPITVAGYWKSIYSVTFSPDGKLVASAGEGRAIELRDVASGTGGDGLMDHRDTVNSVVFSPDGKILASASDDGTVKLWEVATRTLLATLYGHSSSVKSVVFSPDGKLLASSSSDKTIKLWDTAAQNVVATLSGHSKEVVSVAFSPDGKTLASAGQDNTVRLWDVSARVEVATVSAYPGFIRAIVFSPDGKILAGAGDDKTVKLWFAATDKAVEERQQRGN